MMFNAKLKSLMPLVAFVFLFAGLMQAVEAAPRVITWEDLVPPAKKARAIDFTKFADKDKKGIPNISEFGGNKEELDDYLLTMDFMKQSQPLEGEQIAVELDGQEVKIAGYVTPMTFDGDKVIDFLFVPYHGACIHVPPPPANQIVYVENASGLTAEALYEPVWLVGKLAARPVSTVVANVGYSIENARVEPYTE